MSEVVLTEEGFRSGPDNYWRVESAAAMIGLHPQSLQRLYRESGISDYERAGLKIGRTLFFSAAHLESLGYPIKEGSNV